MRKTIIVLVGLTVLISAPIFAGEGWEASLKIGVGTAENKLSFGQKPDATDGIDGLYDVPALLSGDIEAYFLLGEGKYWRDIMADGTKEWTLAVKSELKGETITLKWKPGDFPKGTSVVLMDDTVRKAFDMKNGGSYSYQNNGQRQFRIRVGL